MKRKYGDKLPGRKDGRGRRKNKNLKIKILLFNMPLSDMTMWKFQNWDRDYKQRLGENVFNFLQKDQNLMSYLSDHKYIWGQIKTQARSYQLEDNSLFVLVICKIFEGVLILLSKEMNWFDKFNNRKTPESIRAFLLNNRKNIEQEIDNCPNLSAQQKQEIKDKFFSTVNDFKERHKAVHYGSKLSLGEIDNYDAILTKIREVLSVFLDNGLIK